jgi:hypothetical protein
LVAFVATTSLLVSCSGSGSQVTTAGTPYRFHIVGSPSKSDEQQAVSIIDDRLRAYKGVARLVGGDLVIYLSGPRVSLDPHLFAPDELDFRPVLAGPIPPGTVSKTGSTISATPSSVLALPSAKHQPAVLPEKDLASGKVVQYWFVGPVALTGSALSTASSDLAQTGQWEIRPVFRAGGSGIDVFNTLAAECYSGTSTSCPTLAASIHGQVAIVLDDVVLAAPTIDAPSFERDQITISGSFTEREARAIAAALQSGALPVQLVPLSGGGSPAIDEGT